MVVFLMWKIERVLARFYRSFAGQSYKTSAIRNANNDDLGSIPTAQCNAAAQWQRHRYDEKKMPVRTNLHATGR